MTGGVSAPRVDLVALVDQLADAVIAADAGGQIQLANEAAGRLFGLEPGKLVGKALTNLMPARFRARHLAGFRKLVQTGQRRLPARPLRVSALRSDGGEVEVELTIGAVERPGHPDFLVVGLLRDLRERVALEREVDLSRYLRATVEVANRLQQATDVESAYGAVLPALGENLDWDVAALWLVEEGGAYLRGQHVWRVHGDAGAFESVTLGRRFRRGEGFPGRCWQAGEALTIEVASAEPALSRQEQARADGLVLGLAFPLMGRSGVLGVVELFARRSRPVDPALIDLLGNVGRQLGQFLERIEVEHELAYRAALLASQFEAAEEAVLAVSPDRRVLAFNRRFSDQWGIGPGQISVGADAGPVIRQCLEQVVDPKTFASRDEWAHQHPDETFSMQVALMDGRIIEAYNAPIVDERHGYHGRIWYLRDDTERRAAERQREDLVQRLRAAQRSQRFLLRASDVLAGATGYAETLEKLAAVALPTLGDLCLIDVIAENGRLVRMVARHASASQQPLVDELLRHYPPEPAGPHPSAQAIVDLQSRYSAEMSEEFLRETTQDDRHFQIVKALDFTSYMTVPLVVDGQPLGTVTLVSAGSGRRFDAEDLALAEELAGRVALVVAKARRYEIEQRISHSLQASLLPVAVPDVPGLQIAVRYLPGTRDIEVGGDFYDVVALPSDAIALVVGDVAGHDIVAAATMGQLRSAMHALSTQLQTPGQLVQQLHDRWDQLGLERIATALYMHLEPKTGGLQIASAGHPPPLLLHDGRALIADVPPSPPLGAPATVPVVEWTGVLEPGDLLICYTDGLVEDRDRDIDEGTQRLGEEALTAASTDPEVVCDHLVAALVGKERGDDVALLVIRRD
jgi:PAS domain S-box-containing protein